MRGLVTEESPALTDGPAVRVGMIARMDYRGLGVQTKSIHDAIKPHVTVVVDMGKRTPVMPSHPGWYPDGHVIEWRLDGSLPGALELLSECDVVFSAETFYDWTLPKALDRRGIPSVLHVNPELYVKEWVSHVWLPSSWLRDNFGDVPIMPIGTPIERYPEMPPLDDKPRVIHQAGTGAAYDRQGTAEVSKASHHLTSHDIRLEVTSQSRQVTGLQVNEPWELDAGAWMAVLPRRYGGQSLAVLGWLAAGIPVAMTDIPPQATDWPIIPLEPRKATNVALKGGSFPSYRVDPIHIINAVRRHVADPDMLAAEKAKAREWAELHSWEHLRPMWRREFHKCLVR